MKLRPLHLRRSWLFVGATNENDIKDSYKSEADVCILEFEDFCSPKDRPLGRKNLPKILENWKKKGKVTAVRINPLETVFNAKAILFSGSEIATPTLLLP